MKSKFIKAIFYSSNVGYVLACISLYVLSIGIIGFSFVRALIEMSKSDFSMYSILDEVGLIVFSIAVFDVAKYLLLEEVVKGVGDRHVRDVQTALIKFMNIIITAILLKGLVLAIEVSTTDLTQLIYPIMLLMSPGILLLCLGVYLKLTSN